MLRPLSIVALAMFATQSLAAQSLLSRVAKRVAPPQQQPVDPRTTDLVSITPDVVDRLAKALETEVAERKTAAARIASAKSADAYRACESDVRRRHDAAEQTASNKGDALRQSLAPRLKQIQQEMQQAVASNDQAAMKRLTLEMQQIANGAATSQAAADARPPESVNADTLRKACGMRESDKEQLRRQPVQKALAAGGFTDRQYALLKERLAAYYGHDATTAGDSVRVREKGSDVSYAYGAHEAETLAANRGRLAPLVAETL